MIDLNENLESLLLKIGPKIVSTPSVFSWNGTETNIHIESVVFLSLEPDFQEFYINRLNISKYQKFLKTPAALLLTGRGLINGAYFYNEVGRFLHEAILNASSHGHGIQKNNNKRKRIKRQITVQAYYGKNGVLYSIKDPGQGFDVGEVVRKMNTGESYGQKYVKKSGLELSGGQGFAMFSRLATPHSTLIVSFDYNGSSPPSSNQRTGNDRYGNNILLCHLFHSGLSECFS